MFNWIRDHLLQLLRVPPEPQPPVGAPGSAQVFRAGKNYYRLRVALWTGRQVVALVGILFSVGLLLRLEHDIVSVQRTVKPVVRPSTPAASNLVIQPADPANPAGRPPVTRKSNVTEADVARVAAQAPGWVWPLLNGAKALGVLIYLLQIPITYCAVRLEYEQRWYIVTDRSLRIRAGLWRVQEMTMSFANLQQVVVSEGPVQRLFGIADLQVQSAGGGSGRPQKGEHPSASLHIGIFHGVDNARELRDLVLRRLQAFRETGLGDPDEMRREIAQKETPPAATGHDEALSAAHELLTEARALRRAFAQS